MKTTKITSICNCVCALLLLAALIMQFLPFWTCSGCKTHKDVEQGVSIAEYLWLPKHHTPVTNELTEMYRDLYGPDYRDPATGKKLTFTADFILPSILTVFLGSIVGIVFCVLKRKKFFVAVLPLIVGLAGLLGHLFYPALTIGQNTGLYVVVFIVVTVVAAASLIFGVVTTLREKAKNKAAAQNDAV